MEFFMFKFKDFFNSKGEYLPDPDPVVIAPLFDRPLTLQEQIARLVRDPALLRDNLELGEMETFEEADDFNVDDDFDPRSPWEENFDLAAVGAMDSGVVRSFTPEEVAKARDTQEKARKGFFKRKSKPEATPPREGAEDALDPNNPGADDATV